ncbi:hypothetical protein [Dawidia soli]|uniref:Uncharacterized protein n=1 Tax=Dawidia soli TaxID=2782352 RepID=A0AAP2GJM9_9BACT|nr:hypothetical protein [Dawidia soli]MBT1689556.1 hypothetical protein [Dawidia soli]
MTQKITFPRAFAFAVDDLGWMDGADLSEKPVPGPYRTGVKRRFELSDYQYMIDVGKAVGSRIQCLFILSEMDRTNLLARFPTTTYLREQWDNSHRVSEAQEVIMRFVREQSAYMEFGLHGTGHEYWAPGQPQKRAEWYNLADKEPWPEVSLREHIQCFKDILAQYGITPENGHSFPESFVPCAYSYFWNPTGSYSLGKLLSEAGVKYANTDFSEIPELNPPTEPNGGGFDFNTHVINRINYGNVWYELSSLPKVPLAEQKTDIIESHWPNWLAQDDPLQPAVTARWIEYYKAAQRLPDRYIAKNTEQLHAQWLYNKHTVVTEPTPGVVTLDNTAMPEKAYTFKGLGNLVLKLRLAPGEHIASADLNGTPLAVAFEDEGYGFLYLPPLERQVYTLRYAVGNERPPVHVYNDGTYNVYRVELSGQGLSATLRIYGEQDVKVRCPKPVLVQSMARGLTVLHHRYDESSGYLHMAVKASDMQGCTGSVVVRW